jgi:hypothetical protein
MAIMHNYEVGDLKDTNYLMFATAKSSSVASVGIALDRKVREVLSKRDESSKEMFDDYFVDVIVVFKSNTNKAYSYPCTLGEFDELVKADSLGTAVGAMRTSMSGNPATKSDIDLTNSVRYLNLDKLRDSGEDLFLNKTLLNSTAGFMAKPVKPLPRINISVSPMYNF